MSSIVCFPCPKGPPRCTEGRWASQAWWLVLAGGYGHWLPGFTQVLFLTPPVACGQFRERWGGKGLLLDQWPYCSLCIQTLSCLFWPRILCVNPGSVLSSLGPLLPLFLCHLSLGLEAPPWCIICQSWWVWPLLLPLPCSPPLALMKISLLLIDAFLLEKWGDGKPVFEGIRRGLKLVISRIPSYRDSAWFGSFWKSFSMCRIILIYICF